MEASCLLPTPCPMNLLHLAVLELHPFIVQWLSHVDSCDPLDCSLPVSSVHRILQAKILEWGCHFLLQGIFLIKESKPGLRISGRFFTDWATRETYILLQHTVNTVGKLFSWVLWAALGYDWTQRGGHGNFRSIANGQSTVWENRKKDIYILVSVLGSWHRVPKTLLIS